VRKCRIKAARSILIHADSKDLVRIRAPLQEIWEDMSMKRPSAFAGTMALTIFGMIAALATPAQAQTYDPRYPVCLQVYDDMTHFYFECGYTSMAQCAASASGRYAQCVVNPYYAAPNAKRHPRKKPAT